MKPRQKGHPDYEAIRSRAFGALIGKGGAPVTQREIDRALEAGEAELRYDRRKLEGQLTKRQQQVLECVAQGVPLDRIDHIARETARTHLKNAMKRLEVHTSAHAVAVAMRRGLIR